MFLILEKCYTNVTKQKHKEEKKRAQCVYRLKFNINQNIICALTSNLTFIRIK